MGDLFKVSYKYSNSHLVMPKIVIGVLILLGIILLIQRAKQCKKEGKPFFAFKGYHFFVENYDKVKFWGSIILMAAYIYTMERIHFLPASLIFIFLFNILYDESINFKALFGKTGEPVIRVKSLLISLGISVVFSVAVWYLFGIVFNITLP